MNELTQRLSVEQPVVVGGVRCIALAGASEAIA